MLAHGKHYRNIFKEGTSLATQWLGLHTFTAKGLGSIPALGTKIPQVVPCSQEKDDKRIEITLSILLSVTTGQIR